MKKKEEGNTMKQKIEGGKNNTTNSIGNSNEITIESMALSIKKLEVELKIKAVKESGGKVIAYFPKRFRRPEWIINMLKENKIISKRSSFIEDRNFYLLDTDKLHFWDSKNFIKQPELLKGETL